MSKTIKNVFDEHLTFVKLLEAEQRASIGKKNKKEVILFEMDLETNIIKILNELKNDTYKFGKYRSFIIYEPKERLIRSLPFRDRIVHQWYIEEFIKPFMYKRFIKDTYACLDDKGTHKAVEITQKYMKRMKKKYGKYYILKCDIKKYFYSIDKSILINILSNLISDKKLMSFTYKILADGENISIPIGNYTSQWFANIYLNELDHYVKEKLCVKYYVRYMDDFIFLLKDKEECKLVLNNIRAFLSEKLHLELNHKTKYYPSTMGINFCGFRIFETHRLLRNRCKKKIKKNINLWNRLYLEKKLNKHKVLLCWNSFLGHASHGSSYNFVNKLVDKILFYEKRFMKLVAKIKYKNY